MLQSACEFKLKNMPEATIIPWACYHDDVILYLTMVLFLMRVLGSDYQ